MTVLVVLACAVAAGVVLVGAGALRSRARPLDTEREERWLVRNAPDWVRPTLRYVDRKVVGGIMVAVAFGVLFACALFVGWLLDSIDRNQGFARWDRSAANWGAEHATRRSTDVLEMITNFGSTRWLFIAMAVVGLLLVRTRGWGPIGYLAVVGVGVSLLNNGLKLLVHRERPDIGRLVGFAGSSFPSGHSAAAAACWAAIALVVLSRSGRHARAVGAGLAALIAVAVATSRVLLGVHWLTDVMAGLLVGWTWFLLATMVFGGRLLRFGEPATRVARNTQAPAPEDRHDLEAPASTGQRAVRRLPTTR